MNFDDILYMVLLIFSIAFGYYYRTIENKVQKKNLGTAIGLAIILLVSGIHILHTFITILVNSLIILYVSKKQCHLVSFAFSFLYLLFFRTTIYFGLPYPPAHTNLVQMMLTLKLVGLAFEVNSAYLAKEKHEKNQQNDDEEEDDDLLLTPPSFEDIIHYSLNYIGVLTGPYYRYRTFQDFINLPFSKYAEWKTATIDKLVWVPLYAVLFLWGSYLWPLSYATSEEFYERSWLYRYWFIWPNFFIFRMRIYIGLVLSECVCTMAGLGAYPIMTNPKPGHGPSKNFKEMRKILDNNVELMTTDYNFETIHNINPYGADFGTTYRDGMKHWNICIQYWLAMNVYKRFPNKMYRTTVTMLTSAFWHGVYSGYYVCIGTVPFVLALEDVYVKLILKECQGTTLKIAEWIHWFFRMHFFSYQGIAFLLLDVHSIFHYYNSVYHAGLILGLVMYGVGLKLLQEKRAKARRNAKETSHHQKVE